MKFKKHLKEKIELVLGKMNGQSSYLKSVYITDFDGQYLLDNKGKKYKVGKIIDKIYNIGNNQKIIDAVIGSLLFDVAKTNVVDLIDEIYQGEAKSCMQGDNYIKEARDKLLEYADNPYLYYVKDGETYIGRCIVDLGNGRRGKIYTNGDKFCYALLEIITSKFCEDYDYDLSEKKSELLDELIEDAIDSMLNGGIYNRDLIEEYLYNRTLEELLEIRGEKFIVTLYIEGFIDSLGLKQLGYYDVSSEVYGEQNKCYIIDENLNDILGSDLISLYNEVDGYLFVDMKYSKRFLERYKENLEDEDIEILSGN